MRTDASWEQRAPDFIKVLAKLSESDLRCILGVLNSNENFYSGDELDARFYNAIWTRIRGLLNAEHHRDELTSALRTLKNVE